MKPLRRFWAKLRNGPARRRREIAAELAAHLQLAMADQRGGGVSPAEARRRALVQLGGWTQAEEACREPWTWRGLEARRRDLGYAWRQMRRQPGFAISIILILGLAIGATSTAFSALEALVLRPYPYRQPSRLVQLWDDYGTPGNTGPVSYPDFQDWRRWNHSFSAMSVLGPASYSMLTTGAPVAAQPPRFGRSRWSLRLGFDGRRRTPAGAPGVSSLPRHVQAMTVSVGAFRMLGIRPLLGRGFRRKENRPGADAGTDPIVLSYAFWQSQFGGSRKALGRVVQMDGRPYTITAVMPRGFAFPPSQNIQIWTTTAALWVASGGHPPIAINRGYSCLEAIARLRPGVSLAAARADMNHVAAVMRRAHPQDDERTGVMISGWQGAETARAAPVAEILIALAGLLWLAACASTGGLWLSRAAARRHESGIRAALGAGRACLAAQAMTEAILLAGIASAVGIAIAAVAGASLNAALQLPDFYAPRLGGPVIAFTAAIVVASAAAISLLPALAPRHGGLLAALKTGGAATGQGRSEGRARRILAGAEVALTAVLLISALLLARSLAALEQAPLHFNPSGVLTFTLPAPAEFLPAQVAARYRGLLARIGHLPGVISAGAGDGGPLVAGQNRTAVSDLDGRKIPMRQWMGIEFANITPGYFRTLQIPLRRGREFSPADNSGAPLVIILNQAAARCYFGRANPLGHQLDPQVPVIGGGRRHMWTVVGVVATVKEHGLTGRPHGMIYLPLAQTGFGAQQFFVRTHGDPLALVPAIRAVAAAVDPTQAVFGAQPLEQNYRLVLAMPEEMARFAMLFAALALLLTALGLYAVVAFAVAQRRREIGLRLALGAQPRAAAGLVVRQIILPAAAGLAAGGTGAWAAGHLLASQLFQVRPADPLTFAAGLAALAAIAAAAAYVPGRRAARVDPAESLRCE